MGNSKKTIIILALAALAATAGGCAAPGLSVVPPPKSGKETITFCAAGDVMMDRGVKMNMKKKGLNYPFEKVAPFIKAHDIAFCNLEGTVTLNEKLKKTYAFRCEPGYFGGFKDSGFNFACIANNHIMDAGSKGLSDTIAELKKAGINYSGGGENRADALSAKTYEVKGKKIAFLGYVDMPFKFEELPESEETAQPAHGKLSEIKREIKKAKKQADFVIVSFHWGEEYKHYPTKRQKKLGRAAIDAGAGLVLGHHPHVLQGIEKYKGKYILYSLGNFVFDQYREKQTQSMVFSCKIKNNKITDAFAAPVRIKHSRPAFARGKDAVKVKKNIIKYSKNFNTKFDEYRYRLFLR